MADPDSFISLFVPSQENHTPGLVGYILLFPYHHLLTDGTYDDMPNRVPALSEETIMEHLKTTTYAAATTKREDEEPDICVICQGEYENDELIGCLHCRHEYHVECIKKWLQHNNSCPICKAAAVSQNSKQGKMHINNC